MGRTHSPRIVTDGLVFYLDAANPRSYLGSNTANSLIAIEDRGWSLAPNIPQYDTANSGSWLFTGNSYILFANSAGLYVANNDFSVECSLNVVLNGATQRVAQKGVAGTISYLTNVSAAGRLQGAVSYDGTQVAGANVQYTTSTTFLTANQWYHFVYAVSLSNLTAKVYVNGKQESSTTLTSNVLYNATGNYGFGSQPGAGQAPFSGKISQLKIYNKALSDEEVLNNFNAVRGRYNI